MVKFGMGTIIAIQAILLLWALAGWALAYRRAKKSLKKLLNAQQQLAQSAMAPMAGATAPMMHAPVHRSRSRRDEERIHLGNTNITTFHAASGVNVPAFATPPSYNIVC
jgi:hypothetical protein